MDPKKRMDELVELLKDANYRYYVLDDPKMQDFEYDHLLRELEELEKAAKEFEKGIAEENVVKLAEADVVFHDVIYKASGNARLNQVLNNLREQIYRYRVEYLKDEATRNDLIAEHELICKALRERDAAKAMEITFQHIENQRQAIIQTIAPENTDK